MGGTGLSCGSKMAKFFLFLFNIIFWLIGAVILGVGIWVLADTRALNLVHVATVDSSDSLVRAAAITFIVIGLVVFITGFLGCWGAVKENACMLLTYAIIVGLILFLQIVAGIMGAVFKDKIVAQLADSMNSTVQVKYGQKGQDGLTTAFDYVQKEFKCCGSINGPEDWVGSAWQDMNATRKNTVPASCCPLVDKNAAVPVAKNQTSCNLAAFGNSTADRDDFVWTKGCKPKLEDWIKGHAGMLIGIAFGLAAIQVFGIMLSCCLRSSIRKGYAYV